MHFLVRVHQVRVLNPNPLVSLGQIGPNWASRISSAIRFPDERGV